MAFTQDQICRRSSALTGLTDFAGTDERALMDAWLNEGLSQIFQDTQCVVTDVVVGLTGGQDEYALDRGVLTVLNYAQSSINPSAKISVMNAADILERKFLSSTGFVRYFAVLGGNLLIVSPAPDQDQDIKFYCVPVPDLVEDPSDDIFDTGLPTYGQRAAEAYMNARCFEHMRDYQNSQFWDAQYTAECGKIKIAMRRQAGRTLPASRIGYPDRYSTPSRNDVYPND
jgi:hypothetical protein